MLFTVPAESPSERGPDNRHPTLPLVSELGGRGRRATIETAAAKRFGAGQNL
jgi:hypothetical protein